MPNSRKLGTVDGAFQCFVQGYRCSFSIRFASAIHAARRHVVC